MAIKMSNQHYWAERFARHGYVPLDVIRPLIRSDAKVEVWYRTNMVLYARPPQAATIMAKLKAPHLANLDLPGEIEIVGLKRAAAQFLDSMNSSSRASLRRFVTSMCATSVRFRTD
jgi:hypothetical protein